MSNLKLQDHPKPSVALRGTVQKRFQKRFKQDRHVKQCHCDEINDGGTMDL